MWASKCRGCGGGSYWASWWFKPNTLTTSLFQDLYHTHFLSLFVLPLTLCCQIRQKPREVVWKYSPKEKKKVDYVARWLSLKAHHHHHTHTTVSPLLFLSVSYCSCPTCLQGVNFPAFDLQHCKLGSSRACELMSNHSQLSQREESVALLSSSMNV